MCDTEPWPSDPPPRRPRWAPPDLPERPTHADLHGRQLFEIESEHTIRGIWAEFCQNSGLAGGPAAAGFALREPPLMGPIALGPPTRFSIELRPGFVLGDIADLADRLTWAYRVDDVVVRHLADGWVTVELVEHPAIPATRPPDGSAPVDNDPHLGAGDTDSFESHSPRRPRHLGPRTRRRPFGRPRSLGS